LSPFAFETLSDHVVGANILLPGVGYQEIALVVYTSKSKQSYLSGVVIARPCVLSRTDQSLQYTTSAAGAYEIRSLASNISVTHVTGKHVAGMREQRAVPVSRPVSRVTPVAWSKVAAVASDSIP
jgi:hypothetical protein